MRTRSGALRRRRKRSLVTRLRIAWIFIAAIVGAATYGGYLVTTMPQLRVAAIDVTIDGIAVSEQDVLAAASIDRHANAWLLDTRAIARRIETIPYVDRADVRRSAPAAIHIAVTERKPVACVTSGAREVTVDRSERILQNGCARPSAVRITLAHGTLGRPGSYAAAPGLTALLADGRILDRAHVDVRSLTQDTYGQLLAVDRRGVGLLFGNDADLEQKAKLVAPVMAAVKPGHLVRLIDLRAPATPTVEYR